MNKQAITSITFATVVLFLTGSAGVIYVVTNTAPYLGPRWLLYFFLVIGLTGLALPGVTFLNFRFPSTPVPDGGILIRQSLWFGILGSLLVWLQTGRFLNPALTLFLVMGFIMIEALIRWAERSHWPSNRKNQ